MLIYHPANRSVRKNSTLQNFVNSPKAASAPEASASSSDKTFPLVLSGRKRAKFERKFFTRGEVPGMREHRALIECLGRYSKSNLTMLIFDEMAGTVDKIWEFGERHRNIKLNADEIPLSDVVVYAQENNFDGILLRRIENLSREQQRHLAHLLTKMTTSEKGKFILTSVKFDLLDKELLAILCKINFTFSVSPHSELFDDNPVALEG